MKHAVILGGGVSGKAAVSSVVVVFPFVPVTPTAGQGRCAKPKAISPVIGTPLSRAAR